MANLGGTFDATQVDPTNEFAPLPAGEYEAEIIESKVEDISRDNPGKGRCLTLTWRVAEGPLAARLFWQRLNLWFSGSEKTPGKVVEIAQRQFSEVCHGVGQMHVDDSEQLHYRRALVTYGPQKNAPQYSEVKSVKALGGGAPAQPGPAQSRSGFGAPPPSTAPAASAPSGGGWKRRAAAAPAPAHAGRLDDEIPF